MVEISIFHHKVKMWVVSVSMNGKQKITIITKVALYQLIANHY
ncbi:hypothetical protein CF161_02316 [Pseudomonas sp. CF161]|nr:hypothetical protein CF161_02316 [Pseudomonas sp. CF161]